MVKVSSVYVNRWSPRPSKNSHQVEKFILNQKGVAGHQLLASALSLASLTIAIGHFYRSETHSLKGLTGARFPKWAISLKTLFGWNRHRCVLILRFEQYSLGWNMIWEVGEFCLGVAKVWGSFWIPRRFCNEAVTFWEDIFCYSGPMGSQECKEQKAGDNHCTIL